MAKKNIATAVVVTVVSVTLSGLGFAWAKKKRAESKPDEGGDDEGGDDETPPKDDPATGETPPKGTGNLPPKPEPDPKSPWQPDPHERYKRGEYTVDLTGLGSGIRWRVWLTSDTPGGSDPTSSQIVGRDLETTDDEARVAANAFVDSLMLSNGWVFEQPPTGPEGGALPPVPTPDPPELLIADTSHMFSTKGPGVFASKDCSQIWVADAVSWIAWAAPKIQHRKQMDELSLVEMLLNEAWPDCDWDLEAVTIGGSKSLLDQVAAADDAVLKKLRDGDLMATHVGQPTPPEIAAAMLIGVQPIAHKGKAFPYRGHYVAVNKATANTYTWKVWNGPHTNHAPKYDGLASTRSKAEAEAKAAIDAALE